MNTTTIKKPKIKKVKKTIPFVKESVNKQMLSFCLKVSDGDFQKDIKETIKNTKNFLKTEVNKFCWFLNELENNKDKNIAFLGKLFKYFISNTKIDIAKVSGNCRQFIINKELKTRSFIPFEKADLKKLYDLNFLSKNNLNKNEIDQFMIAKFSKINNYKLEMDFIKSIFYYLRDKNCFIGYEKYDGQTDVFGAILDCALSQYCGWSENNKRKEEEYNTYKKSYEEIKAKYTEAQLKDLIKVKSIVEENGYVFSRFYKQENTNFYKEIYGSYPYILDNLKDFCEYLKLERKVSGKQKADFFLKKESGVIVGPTPSFSIALRGNGLGFKNFILKDKHISIEMDLIEKNKVVNKEVVFLNSGYLGEISSIEPIAFSSKESNEINAIRIISSKGIFYVKSIQYNPSLSSENGRHIYFTFAYHHNPILKNSITDEQLKEINRRNSYSSFKNDLPFSCLDLGINPPFSLIHYKIKKDNKIESGKYIPVNSGNNQIKKLSSCIIEANCIKAFKRMVSKGAEIKDDFRNKISEEIRNEVDVKKINHFLRIKINYIKDLYFKIKSSKLFDSKEVTADHFYWIMSCKKMIGLMEAVRNHDGIERKEGEIYFQSYWKYINNFKDNLLKKLVDNIIFHSIKAGSAVIITEGMNDFTTKKDNAKGTNELLSIWSHREIDEKLNRTCNKNGIAYINNVQSFYNSKCFADLRSSLKYDAWGYRQGKSNEPPYLGKENIYRFEGEKLILENSDLNACKNIANKLWSKHDDLIFLNVVKSGDVFVPSKVEKTNELPLYVSNSLKDMYNFNYCMFKPCEKEEGLVYEILSVNKKQYEKLIKNASGKKEKLFRHASCFLTETEHRNKIEKIKHRLIEKSSKK